MSKKILIVEDEKDMARLLSVGIKSAGFETEVAFDGTEAIRCAHNYKPDLIILDLMLPAGGGFFVLEKIKLTSDTWSIPVIIYSAFKDEERIEQAKEKGADSYFDKTQDIKELIQEINRLLGVSE